MDDETTRMRVNLTGVVLLTVDVAAMSELNSNQFTAPEGDRLESPLRHRPGLVNLGSLQVKSHVLQPHH